MHHNFLESNLGNKAEIQRHRDSCLPRAVVCSPGRPNLLPECWDYICELASPVSRTVKYLGQGLTMYLRHLPHSHHVVYLVSKLKPLPVLGGKHLRALGQAVSRGEFKSSPHSSTYLGSLVLGIAYVRFSNKNHQETSFKSDLLSQFQTRAT